MTNKTTPSKKIAKPYIDKITYLSVENGAEDIMESHKPIGIMLHGFGSNPEDVQSVCNDLSDIIPYWIIPQGPVTLFDFIGQAGYAWFPSNKEEILKALMNNYWENIKKMDSEDIQTIAQKIIGEIIIPLKTECIDRPIVLAGFSQGGMLASEIILQTLERNIVLNEVLLFSSCHIAEARWNKTAKKYIHDDISRVKPPRIWQSHGILDLVLLIKQGVSLNNFWSQYASTQLYLFNGAHEINSKVIQKAKKFLKARGY